MNRPVPPPGMNPKSPRLFRLSDSALSFCSEGNSGDGGVVAYYQSEFEIHDSQQASLDEAIASLEVQEGGPIGRQGRLQLRLGDGLSVNSVISRGLTAPPRLTLLLTALP